MPNVSIIFELEVRLTPAEWINQSDEKRIWKKKWKKQRKKATRLAWKSFWNIPADNKIEPHFESEFKMSHFDTVDHVVYVAHTHTNAYWINMIFILPKWYRSNQCSY